MTVLTHVHASKPPHLRNVERLVARRRLKYLGGPWLVSKPLLVSLCAVAHLTQTGFPPPANHMAIPLNESSYSGLYQSQNLNTSLWHVSFRCNLSLQELAADIANFGSQKEQRTKAAQAKLKAAKGALESAKKAVKDTAQKLAHAVAEAEAATSERASLEEQLQAAQQALTGEAHPVSQLPYVFMMTASSSRWGGK